jgi:protein gp37
MEIKSVWNDLKRYQKMAAEAGEIHRVFVGSMMDIFEKPMPIVDSKGEYGYDASDGSPITFDHLRDRLFEEVIPNSPNLMFLLLTKRPSNIAKYVPAEWLKNPPANVMYGTSPVNQETYDNLVNHLLKVPGQHFLSMEPLLGDVTLKSYCKVCDTLLIQGMGAKCGFCQNPTITPDWIIVGGESGHHARPMHPRWVKSIRDQCKMWEVPFFFKQWGEHIHHSQAEEVQRKNIRMIEDSKDYWYFKPGKKEAGRVLDGAIHNEFPK